MTLCEPRGPDAAEGEVLIPIRTFGFAFAVSP